MDVVVEVARAIGRAAEAADLDRALQDERAVGTGDNELLLDSRPRAFGVLFIGLRKKADAYAFGQRVGEHAACGGLEIVAWFAVVSHDLPPEAGLCVLGLDDRGHGAIERGDKGGALGVAGGEPVEDIDEGHCVPAHGASPDFGAEAGGLVGPGHLLGLVPAMSEQAGVRIAHVLVHEEELAGDVVEVGGLLEGGGVLGPKGLGHVGAVEPHLVGVDLLVPVAAAGGAGLKGELVVEELGGAGVLGVLGDAVEEEDGAAHLDVVQRVRVGFVAGDCAVGGDAGTDRGLDEAEDRGVVGGVPHGGHAVQTDSVFVSPGAGGGGGCAGRVL